TKMRRWIGFLGSWALLVLALGLASFAIAGEVINTRDSKRLDRVAVVDQMIAQRTGNKAGELRSSAGQRQAGLAPLQRRVAGGAGGLVRGAVWMRRRGRRRDRRVKAGGAGLAAEAVDVRCACAATQSSKTAAAPSASCRPAK